jgi:thioredoxin reductase (NADPH)
MKIENQVFHQRSRKFRNKRVVIAGGGFWRLVFFLTDVEVTLIHRRNEFRGALAL